jgi:hypothetical protein
MAVKVMVAPAIARGELDAPRAMRRGPSAPGEEKKPRRRKSAVYDADGNEVFITLMCLKCHKMRPLSQFGLRKMADGAIRNQPWCRTCRSGASPKARKGSAETVESAEAVESATLVVPVAEPEPSRADAGMLAAQVAAALHNGRG